MEEQISNQNFFSQKSPKKSSGKCQYQFPSRDVLDLGIKSPEEFWLHLNKDSEHKLWTKKQKNNYVYFKCKFCKASIHLKRQQSEFRVLRFYNIHHHNSQRFKNKEERSILQFMESLPSFYSQTQIKTRVLSKFSISARRYYYILRKSRKEIQFSDLMNILVQRGNQVRYNFSSQNQFPQSLLIFSRQMKAMYSNWGDLVCMDVTYNLIKNKPKNFKSYGVVIFCGMDSNLRITIFGYGIICNENTDSFKQIIKQFLKIYEKHPSSFITDEQIAIKSAFNELRDQNIYRGSHILDSFHILKNLRRKVPQDSFQIFRKLLRTSNQQRMLYHYQKLHNTKCTKQIISHFQSRSQYYCLGKIPSNFVGFNCSSSRCEKLNDIVKSIIPREVSYSSLFFRFEKIQSHIIKNLSKYQYQAKKYEELFNDFGIKQVRLNVQKKVFQKFIENYTKGLRLECSKSGQNSFLCSSPYQKYLVFPGYSFCQCQYFQKTGIPCAHLIKCTWSLNSPNYIELFNKRWIVSSTKKTIESRGRPRNSRRNMIK